MSRLSVSLVVLVVVVVVVGVVVPATAAASFVDRSGGDGVRVLSPPYDPVNFTRTLRVWSNLSSWHRVEESYSYALRSSKFVHTGLGFHAFDHWGAGHTVQFTPDALCVAYTAAAPSDCCVLFTGLTLVPPTWLDDTRDLTYWGTTTFAANADAWEVWTHASSTPNAPDYYMADASTRLGTRNTQGNVISAGPWYDIDAWQPTPDADPRTFALPPSCAARRPCASAERSAALGDGESMRRLLARRSRPASSGVGGDDNDDDMLSLHRRHRRHGRAGNQ